VIKRGGGEKWGKVVSIVGAGVGGEEFAQTWGGVVDLNKDKGGKPKKKGGKGQGPSSVFVRTFP